MQGDNGVVNIASEQPSLNAHDATAQQADLVRQLTGAGSSSNEGGLIAQLSNNPLFTGVCIAFEILVRWF